MSDYKVELVNDNMQEFFVEFHGPEDSSNLPVLYLLILYMIAPFQDGVWRLHVELPDQYPYKSPSIGFKNRIFHPNIDEAYDKMTYTMAISYVVCRSGSVCLDVINQSWSSMFSIQPIYVGEVHPLSFC